MRRMTKTALAILLLSFPALAQAAPFSIYGIKMGMTRQELDQVWIRLPSGEYSVKNSILFNIKPEFDYRDRLYILAFSLPLPEDYPSGYAASAFQTLVQETWGDDRNAAITVRAGKGFAEVGVTNRALMDEYIQHIKLQLVPLLKP